MKILITGANGDIAISISRIIKKHFKKYKINGTDIENIGPGEIYYDHIYKVSKPNNLDYAKQIKNIKKL